MSQVRKGARDITVVILAIRRLLGIRVLFLSSTLVHVVKFKIYHLSRILIRKRRKT